VFAAKRQAHATAELGLAIVEEIVRAHHGEIEILSVEGRGTEAVVRLPAAPASGGAQPAAEAARRDR
jgi:signal transduction histidine kinase